MNFDSDTKKAILTSEISMSPGDHCLRLKYFTDGDNETLQINRIGSNGKQPLFKSKLETRNIFAVLEIEITGNGLFRIEFEVTLKKDKPMFLAIYDVKVGDSSCDSYITTEGPTTESLFTTEMATTESPTTVSTTLATTDLTTTTLDDTSTQPIPLRYDSPTKVEHLSCNFDDKSMCRWRDISEPQHGGQWRIS